MSQFGAPVSTGVTVFTPNDRRPAPAVQGITLDGRRLSLAALSGHVVVINAWASWCGACRDEAQALTRVARESASKGVRFVGINTHDPRWSAEEFVRTFKTPYPSIVDSNGQVILAFRGMIPIGAIPDTLVVDPGGRIVARLVGPVDYKTLRGLVGAGLGAGHHHTGTGGKSSR
ncbi:MAG: TlpA family protein disulfide reductase [Actinomycetota bacterium]|nr:TlpA family protein disulfide reductase [Actinomycetota bacterium]